MYPKLEIDINKLKQNHPKNTYPKSHIPNNLLYLSKVL